MGEGEEKEGGSVIVIALGVCEQHHQKPLYAPLFSQPAKSFTSSPPPRMNGLG